MNKYKIFRITINRFNSFSGGSVMKKALSILFSIILIVSALPLAASANDAVSYIDENGELQSTTDYIVVTSETTTFLSGWYVVSSDVEISSRITVVGSVILILADGCTLTADKGIEVDGDNKLSVCGQTAQTGALVTGTPENYYAGIGSDEMTSTGTIIINGGNITAQGGMYAAGIGSSKRNYGDIIINTGNVTAYGGVNAAGIGNGQNASAGHVTINGGTVTAKGGNQGSGIGGGLNSAAGFVTINGGIVNAKGGYYGAAIGGGNQTKGGSVYIYGGNITADSNGANTYGIGNGQTANSSVKVYLNWINPTGSIYSVSYRGDITFEKDFVLEGTSTIATKDNSSNKTIVPAEGLVKYIDADGSLKGCLDYTTAQAGSSNVTWTGGWYVVSDNITVSGKILISGTVNLIICDGAKLTASGGIVLTYGNTLTVYSQTESTGTLAARGASGYAGIGGYTMSNREYSCGTLVINGGVINAFGGAGGAGIGGGKCAGGIITVNRGTVTAIGGTGGAGIGGGTAGYGGVLTVNGGTVNATGANGAAGIGSGAFCISSSTSKQFNVTINGGTVTAMGSMYTNTSTSEYAAGAGIGAGGCYASAPNDAVIGSVTINGGNVTANGVTQTVGKKTVHISAGIGAGSSCTLSNIYPVTLTLNWTSIDDSIFATKYDVSSVTFSKDFRLNNTATLATATNIGNKTIVPYIFGDIDTDGDADLADYDLIYAYIKGTGELTDYQLLAADLDGDTAVDAFDLFSLDKAINGQS